MVRVRVRTEQVSGKSDQKPESGFWHGQELLLRLRHSAEERQQFKLIHHCAVINTIL